MILAKEHFKDKYAFSSYQAEPSQTEVEKKVNI